MIDANAVVLSGVPAATAAIFSWYLARRAPAHPGRRPSAAIYAFMAAAPVGAALGTGALASWALAGQAWMLANLTLTALLAVFAFTRAAFGHGLAPSAILLFPAMAIAFSGAVSTRAAELSASGPDWTGAALAALFGLAGLAGLAAGLRGRFVCARRASKASQTPSA